MLQGLTPVGQRVVQLAEHPGDDRAQAEQPGPDGVALGELQPVGQPVRDVPQPVRLVDLLPQRLRIEHPRIRREDLLGVGTTTVRRRTLVASLPDRRDDLLRLTVAGPLTL